jgi:uncharacterized protein (DUF58 family)
VIIVDGVRRAATLRLRAWAARRHGRDALPVTVHSRRIYILPTRFGLMMAALVVAMLVAGLNYNSNPALAFAFLMASLAVVAMHHCHRNLLGLWVNAAAETDAFAGSPAGLRFEIRNDSEVDRHDIGISCRTAAGESAAAVQSAPQKSRMPLVAPLTVAHRGVIRIDEFELSTRHPFGWFRAWSYVHAPLTVYVAPRPQGTLSLPPAATARGAAAASQARGDEDFAGLRSYQPGMPLKHMAWKVLARGAEPAVRSYSGLGAEPDWLDWFALEGLAPEARLSQLCRWVLEREAAGHSYALRLPGIELAAARGAAHRRACLRALAAFEAAG